MIRPESGVNESLIENSSKATLIDTQGRVNIILASAMAPFACRCPVSGSSVRHRGCIGVVCNMRLKKAYFEILVKGV